jgi:hypothetical protein
MFPQAPRGDCGWEQILDDFHETVEIDCTGVGRVKLGDATSDFFFCGLFKAKTHERNLEFLLFDDPDAGVLASWIWCFVRVRRTGSGVTASSPIELETYRTCDLKNPLLIMSTRRIKIGRPAREGT